MIPDDIKTLAVPILSHRVLGKSFLQAGEFGAAETIIRSAWNWFSKHPSGYGD